MKHCIWLVSFGLTVNALAAQTLYHFDTAAEQRRYENLIHSLRCVVCQNESVAGSQAPLAVDLRAWVYQRMREGDNEQTIQTALIHRFGEQILYQPRFTRTTALLWLLPGFVLILGVGSVCFVFRRGRCR